MQKIIVFLLLSIFFISCSSTKQIKNEGINLNKYHQGINNIEINSSLKTAFKDNNLSTSINLKIAKEDSLVMKVSAIFGITVAKLYSDPNKFIFYNMFENKGFTGTPSMENFNKLTRINLSYFDFIRLIKSEIPGDLSKFSIYKKDEAKNEIIYKSKRNNETAEFVVLALKDNKLLQYQQKNIDGTLVTNVFFKDYRAYDGHEFASKIIFQFPTLEGEMTFDFEDLFVNPKIESQFFFNLPSSIEQTKLD